MQMFITEQQRAGHYMGNSSLSVEQALGSFNFVLHRDEEGYADYFHASIGVGKFLILHHSHSVRPPTKYSDPVSVSMYETYGKLHYRSWVKDYESVTHFLGVIHARIPWQTRSCEVQGCNSPPEKDARRCERHLL